MKAMAIRTKIPLKPCRARKINHMSRRRYTRDWLLKDELALLHMFFIAQHSLVGVPDF